jgi:hypothetical protein
MTSISWGKVVQIGPSLWARIGHDSNGELHLLVKNSKTEVEKMQGVHYHDLEHRCLDENYDFELPVGVT